MNTVHILRTDKEVKLLFNDMRREILRSLSKAESTANRLASELELSAPTVSHHLELLRRSGFVEVVRMEPESHGIVQKFYSASAQAYVIDASRLSRAVRRYFMPVRIERTRGMIAALSLLGKDGFKPSSSKVEFATEELASLALKAAERRQGPCVETDPECVINDIYRDALRNLLGARPELFPRIS